MSNTRADQHGKIIFLLEKINKLMRETIEFSSINHWESKLDTEVADSAERQSIRSVIEQLDGAAKSIKAQESSHRPSKEMYDESFKISEEAIFYFKNNINDTLTLNPYKNSLVNSKRFNPQTFDALIPEIKGNFSHAAELTHYIQLFNHLMPVRDLLIATGHKFLTLYQSTLCHILAAERNTADLKKSVKKIGGRFSISREFGTPQHLPPSPKQSVEETKNAEDPKKLALIKAQKKALPALGELINAFTFDIPRDISDDPFVTLNDANSPLQINIEWAAALSRKLFGTDEPSNSPQLLKQADALILSTLTNIFINQRNEEIKENNSDEKESDETSRQAAQMAAKVIAAALEPEPQSPLPSPRRTSSVTVNSATGNIQNITISNQEKQNTGCCKCIATWWNRRKAEAKLKERLLPKDKKPASRP